MDNPPPVSGASMLPEGFEILDGHAQYRPAGRVALGQAIEMVASAIACARDRGIERLLVDSRALEGFLPPSTMERFHLAQTFARVARGLVKLALVVRPAMMNDPDKFGVTVARNRGLIADVFLDCESALAWLLDSYDD